MPGLPPLAPSPRTCPSPPSRPLGAASLPSSGQRRQRHPRGPSGEVVALLRRARRGLLVVGPLAGGTASWAAGVLAQTLQWPVAADVLSGLRSLSPGPAPTTAPSPTTAPGSKSGAGAEAGAGTVAGAGSGAGTGGLGVGLGLGGVGAAGAAVPCEDVASLVVPFLDQVLQSAEAAEALTPDVVLHVRPWPPPLLFGKPGSADFRTGS